MDTLQLWRIASLVSVPQRHTAVGGRRFFTMEIMDAMLHVGAAVSLLMTASKSLLNVVPSTQQPRSA